MLDRNRVIQEQFLKKKCIRIYIEAVKWTSVFPVCLYTIL